MHLDAGITITIDGSNPRLQTAVAILVSGSLLVRTLLGLSETRFHVDSGNAFGPGLRVTGSA